MATCAASGTRYWLILLLTTWSVAYANGAVSLKRDVAPILNKHCVQCRMTGTELGNFSLYHDPRAIMVEIQSTQCALNLVEPGKPEQSYVLLRMLGTQATVGGKGLRMPWEYDLSRVDILGSPSVHRAGGCGQLGWLSCRCASACLLEPDRQRGVAHG